MSSGLKKAIIFFIGGIISLYILSWLYGKILRHDKQNKVSWAEQFHDKNFNFVFVGNSRTLIMTNAKELSNRSGLQGINLGLDGSNIMHNYLQIYELYKNKNSIKNIYINIDPWAFQQRPGNEIRAWNFIPFLNDDTIFNCYKEVYGKKVYLWNDVPFYAYALFNSRLGAVSVSNTLFHFLPEIYNEYGDYKTKTNKKINTSTTLSMTRKENIKIRNVNVNFLERLIKLCNGNKTSVHLYTAPALDLFYNKFSNIDSIEKNILMPLCKKYHADYINFCKEKICTDANLFYDLHHLNQSGTEIFTNLLDSVYFKKK